MKQIKQFLLFILLYSISNQYMNAQRCPDYIGNAPPYPVCADSYGDANGNSIWNWELNASDPKYCDNWYARNGNGTYFLLGSPFVGASGKLSEIANANDYTKAKGWELLRRNFGCSSQNKYPYFILYNKYTGLLRVFVYLADAPQTFTSIMMRLEATDNRTSINSLTRGLVEAANEYKDNKVTAKDILIYLSPSPGATWSVNECNLGFDPYINDLTNIELSIGIFGVVKNTLTASITGTSGTAGSPEAAQRAAFATTSDKVPSSSTPFNFQANGEKLIKFSDNIEKYKTKIAEGADKTFKALENTTDSFLKDVRDLAGLAKTATDATSAFSKTISSISGLSKQGGAIFGLIGSVIGFFGSTDASPPPAPSYTSYNLSLTGSLEQITSITSMNVKIPGSNRTNNNNTTYFSCPVGIFNIQEKPSLAAITYKRYVGQIMVNGKPARLVNAALDYTSYQVNGIITPIYNASNGLEIVSAEAAILGQAQNINGNPAYDPFSTISKDFYSSFLDGNKTFNPMKMDFEAGRLLVTNYDSEKGFHVFQTPFVDFKYIIGQAFNVDKRTNVWIRVKVILKRKDDPLNTPILFIKDYAVTVQAGSNPPNTNYSALTLETLPPYANYTIPFNRLESNINLDYKAITSTGSNNSLYSTYFYKVKSTGSKPVSSTIEPTKDVVLRVSGAINGGSALQIDSRHGAVEMRAGAGITLSPGGFISYGSNVNLTSDFGTKIISIANPPRGYYTDGNCYNTNSATPARSSEESEQLIFDNNITNSIYPNPAKDFAIIELEKGFAAKNITVQDIKGITHKLPTEIEETKIHFDVSTLSTGIYIIQIDNGQTQLVRKLIIAR